MFVETRRPRVRVRRVCPKALRALLFRDSRRRSLASRDDARAAAQNACGTEWTGPAGTPCAISSRHSVRLAATRACFRARCAMPRRSVRRIALEAKRGSPSRSARRMCSHSLRNCPSLTTPRKNSPSRALNLSYGLMFGCALPRSPGVSIRIKPVRRMRNEQAQARHRTMSLRPSGPYRSALARTAPSEFRSTLCSLSDDRRPVCPFASVPTLACR